MSKLSFTVIGTPNSGAGASRCLSSARARLRARSKSRTTTALMLRIEPFDPGDEMVRQFQRSRSVPRAPWRPAGARGGRMVGHAIDELKAPPSSSRLWPTMKPDYAAHRKAQASPNSAGSPTRPVGFSSPAQCQFFLHRAIVALREMRGAAAQPVGQERAGQDVVDRHVMLRHLTRQAGDETGQPGARAVAHAKLRDRRLHRGRGDVHDAAELALDHAIDHRLDHEDRRQHVGVQRLDPGIAVPFAEIARRRPAGVVHQDVRCRGRRRAQRRGPLRC